MKTGRGWSREHVLSDGTRVTLRHIRPDDAGELLRAFAELSPETRYRRFLHATASLSPADLRYLTQVDGRDHVAIVAVADSPDLKTERGLGVARFVRVPGEPDVAEAAIVVVDSMQHKGLGRLLAIALGTAARERGIHHFRGEVLASNVAVRELIESLGGVVKREAEGSLVFDASLDDGAGDPPFLRLLREAATRLAEKLHFPALGVSAPSREGTGSA